MLTHHKAGCQGARPCWACATTPAACASLPPACNLPLPFHPHNGFCQRHPQKKYSRLLPRHHQAQWLLAVMAFCLQANLILVNGQPSAKQTPIWLEYPSLDELEAICSTTKRSVLDNFSKGLLTKLLPVTHTYMLKSHSSCISKQLFACVLQAQSAIAQLVGRSAPFYC